MAVSSSEVNGEIDVLNKSTLEDGEIEPLTSTNKAVAIEDEGGMIHEADTSGMSLDEDLLSYELRHSNENCRKVVRFLHVVGHEGRANDVLYGPPMAKEYLPNGVESSSSDHDLTRVMVYFGGDIQDLPEAMELQLDNREHTGWNLENTATFLQNQFPDRHIVVIRPSRMQLRTYSCFDNFLPSNHLGIPEHTPYHGALLHLKRLLRELSHLVEEDRRAVEARANDEFKPSQSRLTLRRRDPNLPIPKPLNLDSGDISLVGFSKGCVVLNQFLYEFHYLKTLTPDDHSFDDFLSCIHDMYWLDGGHSGGKNTWIVSRSLLETLSRLRIRIHVHVTPYQIRDERRSIIQREERVFSDSLRGFGAPISRFVHFDKKSPSLSLHFSLLLQFGSPSVPNEFPEEWEHTNEVSMAEEPVLN